MLEIFKFKDVGGGPVTLVQGEVINGIDDAMWVEKYRSPGEFKFKGNLSSGLQLSLPIGSLISHTNTAEVMMVESHKIIDESDKDTTIEVTGRSFDGYLDERIIGWSLYWQYAGQALAAAPVYVLAAGTSYQQATALIRDGINTARTPAAADDRLINVNEFARITLPGVNYPGYPARNMRRESMLRGLLSILEIDDLGIRTVRPGVGITNVAPIADITRFVVHDGIDRSGDVVFSWDLGDLDGAEYLYTSKKNKTEAVIVGRYLDQVATSTETGINRREMAVDGSDIDNVFNTYPPAGAAKDQVLAAMALRGQSAVQGSNDVEIVSVNVSKTNPHRYRTDYDIGDLVLLDANYGVRRVVRVTEYVEIDNKDGSSGYPTLSILNGEEGTWKVRKRLGQ